MQLSIKTYQQKEFWLHMIFRFCAPTSLYPPSLLSQVLLYLKNEHSNLKVAVASPTNKVKNIRLMANKALETDASQQFAFYTLASILGLDLDINIYTGNDCLKTDFSAIAWVQI